MSKAIIICGQTGTGKTTVAKSILSKVYTDKLLIYDINNEYTEFQSNEVENVLTPESHSVDEFLDIAKNSSGKLILFEEATIFFDSRSNPDAVRDILVKKRHRQNFVIFVFHSLRKVPNNIIDLCNYLYLLPTNDSLELVKRKFEGFNVLIEAVEKKQTEKFKPIQINLI